MIRVTIALLSLVCLQFIFGQVDSASLDLKDASNDTLGEEETATWFPLRISSGIDPLRGNGSLDPRKLPDSYGAEGIDPEQNYFCSGYSHLCWKWCTGDKPGEGFIDYYCYMSPFLKPRKFQCGHNDECDPEWPCVSDCYK